MLRFLVATALLVLPLLPEVLLAQASMQGIVRDDSTARPIAGAEVILAGTPHRILTDDAGRYRLAGLPAGSFQVIIRAVGYLPSRTAVLLVEGEATRVNQTLIPSVVVLEPIEVTETPERGLAGRGYEERKRMGFGRFYDPEELRELEHLRLNDVLRRKGEVEIYGREGIPMNSHMRDLDGRLNCFMSVYLDGFLVHRGGKPGDGGIALRDLIGVHQLVAIEVYGSAAGIPIEFGGASGQCGAIVLWTRRAP